MADGNRNGSSLKDGDIEAAFRLLQYVKQEYRQEPASVFQTTNGDLVALAKYLRSIRAMRRDFFEADLFGEAAWDILLSLYIAFHERYNMKVVAVCHESGVPDTTALRWIERLVELGHVRRRQNPRDARSTLLELAPETVAKMDQLLRRVSKRNTTR